MVGADDHDQLVAGDLLDGDPSDQVDPDVALAVVTALVDDVLVEPGPDGTSVRMRWPLELKVS